MKTNVIDIKVLAQSKSIKQPWSEDRSGLDPKSRRTPRIKLFKRVSNRSEAFWSWTTTPPFGKDGHCGPTRNHGWKPQAISIIWPFTFWNRYRTQKWPSKPPDQHGSTTTLSELLFLKKNARMIKPSTGWWPRSYKLLHKPYINCSKKNLPSNCSPH